MAKWHTLVIEREIADQNLAVIHMQPLCFICAELIVHTSNTGFRYL